MASTLVNFALSSIKPQDASYYGDINDSNPVVNAFNRELKEVMAYFVKKATGAVQSGEACSRGSNWLFEVWNKYEPRFPALFFYNKLIEIGDFLRSVGAYDVASRQCYRRYLITRYETVPTNHYEDPVSYKNAFFKDDEKDSDYILTSRALLGMYIADFYSLCVRDSGLLDVESVPQCILIMKGLRTLMQCLMVNESFCWMVYNCTIIMYSICRSLMSANNSVKAVDYLLWAAMCMESIVPLLGVKYLQWRIILYSAICLAYYDCKAGHHAENFARRGLSKLRELSELERLSDSTYSVETQCIFRQATAKMASMVFKRTVFETRRKQKGVLRPKVRPNIKDMAQMSWPRSVTEKLLTDMFEGSAAQFLAILEALSSSHRRTFQNAPYSSESEMVEVASELFFAGKEIIAGGGGTGHTVTSGADHSVLAGVQSNTSLIDLAAAGLDGVTLTSVVRFVKLAFCYDMWAIFDSMLDCTLIYIKKTSSENPDKIPEDGHSATELCLALMLVMQRVSRVQSAKKLPAGSGAFPNGRDEVADRASVQTMAASSPNVQIHDDLVNLAETVLYCINDPGMFKPQGLDGEILIDKDMIMDATLLLWQKCKKVLGKLPASSKKDFGSALLKSGDPDRWLHILTVVHTALLWCDVGLVDPTVIAEVCLRLATSLESVASTDNPGSRSGTRGASRMTVYSTSQATPNAQLVKALSVLKSGLKVISSGRSNDVMNDGKSVADILWMNKAEQLAECKISTSNAFIRDLIIEILVVYYRISFRLVEKPQGPTLTTTRSRFSTPRATPSKPAASGDGLVVLSEKKIKDSVGGSLLCRAIYLMEKANQPGVSRSQVEKLLEKSMKAIEDAEEEEKRIFEESWMKLNNPYHGEDPSDMPPAPILLSRSDTSMTFKPAPFDPEREEVAWYKIFGRLAAGPNVKVRLNDYYLPGTGDEVPAGPDCLLRVSGLKGNHRYVFAVAAYTSEGKLIGNAVGCTSTSIVASHPLSCLATWGHLAHVSYKLNCPKLSKKACSVLWDIFVAPPSDSPSMSWTTTARQDYDFTVHHLNRVVAMESSPVLLHHALTAVFVAVDTNVREKELFCDKFCEQGPLLNSQLSRMKECERMLVAMEMAGWLNDTSLVLQAVVQTYGLIAPIIQANVMTVPVLQVAIRCICALLETRILLKQKRSGNAADSLNHMVAVLTNYIATYAKSNGNSRAAVNTIDTGRTLLRGDPVALPGRKQSTEHTSGKKRAKKAASAEPLGDKSTLNIAELAALEERLADVAKEARLPDELTGMEDANLVITKLAKMKTMFGFREVARFKRRSRYLEFFVIVLRKAVKMLNLEVAVECSQDVISTLHRRNETLAVNQAVVSKQPGGVAVQGSESKKYAAAVAEYAVDAKKSKKEAGLRMKAERQKKFSPKFKKGGTAEDHAEVMKRNAMHTLGFQLGKYYRNYLKRKKFRKVLNDEIVHKSEFNMLNGLLHFQVFMEKVRDRHSARGFKLPVYGNFEFLDQEWWSLNTSGALVVGWDEGRSTSEIGAAAKEQVKNYVERPLEKAAYVAISSTFVSEPNKDPPLLEEDKRTETPRTQPTRSVSSAMSQTIDHENWIALDLDLFLPTLKLSLLCFQRAMVLAHRGKCWTLLQNTASSFYSTAMAAYQVACDGTEPNFSVKECREMLRLPMTMAADLLVDMLMAMDSGVGDKDWLVNSVVGEKKEKKGGLSLKFDKYFDDVGFVNLFLVKKIVFQTIQILHYSTRYEKLIDICLRFTEVTHDCYYDVISPLLIHAQAKLAERIHEFSGAPHPQSHFADAAIRLEKPKVENRDYLRYNLKVNSKEIASSVDVGGFIDPESHDVYGGGKRALALSSVPFDPEHSMEKLKEAFYGSQYTCRALQYSRRLLLIYLASQHNAAPYIKKGGGKKLVDSVSGSCVEFSLKADESHAPVPPDLSKIDFTSTDSVEFLASPQSSTVIQAYNRTIELLESHGEHDLVSQASNELANLLFHLGNTKSASKWWKHSLDQVLRSKDSLNQWRTSIKDDDNSAEELLSTCGLWGCFHAVNVACKIGEFSSSDTTVRTECALLASALIRSVFRSSMPHPSADFDYASYEILPSSFQSALLSQSKYKVTLTSSHLLANCLLYGIDFFSDNFRLDVQSLIGSLHWLSDYLVQMKFHLQALPVIVMYQYLVTFVCRDKERSGHCRCMKLTALTELRMFKEASSEMMNLLFGAKLPHCADVAYAPAEAFPLSTRFDVAKPIDEPDNLKILEVIASKRLSYPLSQVYGPHLTCEITLCQANLLIQLASCISFIPQKPTMQDLQFVTPEMPDTNTKKMPASLTSNPRSKRNQSSNMADDARSTISSFSTASASKNVSKLFTMRERPMGLQLLKGMLLAVADNLVTTVAKPLESSTDALLASEIWIFVQCLLAISEIQQQRQLSTLSAAKAMRALSILQDASIFNEKVDVKPKKPRSAMRGRNENDEGRQSYDSKSEFYPVVEQFYRARLNSRLWLDCRLRMCQALTSQIKGLGKIEKNLPKTTGLLDHSQVQLICAEGLAEAEACNDVEMQAFYLIQGASLDGITSNECKHMLEDASSSLDEQAELSSKAVQALIESTTLLADIGLASGSTSSPESLQSYRSAQSVLLLKAMQEGETIRHFQLGSDLSTLEEPPINIYTSSLLLLAQIKLRIGQALLQTLEEDRIGQDYTIVSQIFTQAETLSSTSVCTSPLLQAEINLELGKVQKLLFGAQILPIKPPMNALKKAISLSEENACDLATTRQAHLETALLHLLNIDQQIRASSASTITERATTSFPLVKGEYSEVNIAHRSHSMDYGVVSQPLEVTHSRDQIALALHSAYYAACGMRQRCVLPGDPKVTSLDLSNDDRVALPDFLVVDLATDHNIFPKTLSTSDDTYDPIVSLLKMTSTSISWIHIFMYNVLLQRKSRLSTSYTRENPLDFGMKNEAESNATSPQSESRSPCVRTTLKSGDIHIRLSAMHHFLSRHPSYEAICQIQPLPGDTSFVVAQWHWSDDRSVVQLLWCVHRKDGTAECGRVPVNAKILESVAQQATSTKKQTDEFFARKAPVTTSKTPRRKSRAKSLQVDPQLEDDWIHVINQIINLLSNQDEPISTLPFSVSMSTTESVVEFFSVGCYFESSHSLYSWMSKLLSPC